MKLKESMKEINEMNKNIQILEDENYKKEEYLSVKKKNDENISKLNELDEEIKYHHPHFFYFSQIYRGNKNI
jgi:hypothetical protein